MSDVLEIQLQAKGMNALGIALLERVRDQLREAGRRPILLTGAVPAFSAGLNLKEVVAFDDTGMRNFLVVLDEVCERLFSHPAPTVAAVDGHAIAGGAVLARCCDLAVGRAGGRGRVGLNEVAIGLRFPPRILRMMLAKISREHHNTVILGAGLHKPEAALALGLLDVLSEDPEATARQRLAALAAHPADAYAVAKSALYAGVTEVTAAEQAAFADEVVPVWTSDAVKARIRAILG